VLHRVKCSAVLINKPPAVERRHQNDGVTCNLRGALQFKTNTSAGEHFILKGKRHPSFKEVLRATQHASVPSSDQQHSICACSNVGELSLSHIKGRLRAATTSVTSRQHMPAVKRRLR
jgi:hypothetical protein